MKPIPYKAESMDNVVLIGDDDTRYMGEYMDMRIDRSTIPKGKYAYDCRHGDNGDWITPVTIENRVIVNFAGTLVTDTPVVFPDVKCPYISLKGWVYAGVDPEELRHMANMESCGACCSCGSRCLSACYPVTHAPVLHP